jgi:hypothetical protein
MQARSLTVQHLIHSRPASSSSCSSSLSTYISNRASVPSITHTPIHTHTHTHIDESSLLLYNLSHRRFGCWLLAFGFWLFHLCVLPAARLLARVSSRSSALRPLTHLTHSLTHSLTHLLSSPISSVPHGCHHHHLHHHYRLCRQTVTGIPLAPSVLPLPLLPLLSLFLSIWLESPSSPASVLEFLPLRVGRACATERKRAHPFAIRHSPIRRRRRRACPILYTHTLLHPSSTPPQSPLSILHVLPSSPSADISGLPGRPTTTSRVRTRLGCFFLLFLFLGNTRVDDCHHHLGAPSHFGISSLLVILNRARRHRQEGDRAQLFDSTFNKRNRHPSHPIPIQISSLDSSLFTFRIPIHLQGEDHTGLCFVIPTADSTVNPLGTVLAALEIYCFRGRTNPPSGLLCLPPYVCATAVRYCCVSVCDPGKLKLKRSLGGGKFRTQLGRRPILLLLGHLLFLPLAFSLFSSLRGPDHRLGPLTREGNPHFHSS